MRSAIFLDNVIDPASILYRIRCIANHHVRGLTRRMDMDIPESEEWLNNPWGMSIHFLNTVEWAFTHGSRQRWYLIDTDDPRISDNEEIEFIIDPVDQYKCEKYDPIEWEPSPIEATSKEINNCDLIIHQYGCRYEEREKIEKVKYEYNPMPMKGKLYLFIIPQEGDVLFFDHVIWGSLR